MFKPLALFIGSRYTNLKRRDHFITFISLVSMIGIALSIMVLITVLSVMNGFSHEIRERILSVTPHITLNAWPGGQLDNWQVIAEKIQTHNEVEAVGPYIDGQGMLTRAKNVQGIMVRGIEPTQMDAVFPLRNALTAGQVEDLEAGSFGVIIGAPIAKMFRVGVGDSITLIIPEVNVSLAGVAPRMKRLTIKGIFDVGYIYDSALIFMHLTDAAKVFRTHQNISGIQAKLSDPFTSRQVTHELINKTKGQFSIIDWTKQNSAYFSAVKMEKTMMFFTLMLILAIAVFNLISTLVMVVTDKRADIAILRTMGASRGKIMGIFICQGAVIGFIGTVFGVIAGILLASNVTAIVSHIEKLLNVQFLATDVYYISFLPSKLMVKDIVTVASCGFGLSLLATIHPAWRASNILPAQGLRHEQ